MYINDEHEQDNSAVTALIEMLHTGEFPALLLFPSVPAYLTEATEKKQVKAVKEVAALASLDGDEDYNGVLRFLRGVPWPSRDNRPNRRINQRTTDSMQSKKIAPDIKQNLKDEEW
jgi:hypothetical protein